MINFSKYKFYRAGNKTIAVSTYAGKTVRGVASCDPRDTFSEDIGKRLAAARCNVKVARKRVDRACRKCYEAEQALIKAQNHYNDMVEYYNDAGDAYDEAWDDLVAIENAT